MLTQIHISNVATISELNLELLSGTTVITGETGAGKSILIDAIELALGNRAAADIVRAGQEKADVSICFDIRHLSEVHAWLSKNDLDNDLEECIIRRTINQDGRSRSYINGIPTTLQPLRELSALLINIVGQHEHQTLLKHDIQRFLLDRYAGHTDLVAEVHSFAHAWHAIMQEIKALHKLSQEAETRSELLKFQLQELIELNLAPDEFQILDIEHKQLAHGDELRQQIQLALNNITDNEESNVLSLLNHTLQALETVERVDTKISLWIESLKSILIQTHDMENELRRYFEKVELDPERLQWVEQRISALFDTARKHKVAPEALFQLQQTLTKELQEIENSDERLAQLNHEQQDIEKKYQEAATRLSQSRQRHAKKLGKEITHLIRELSLPHSEFHVCFETMDTSFSQHGLDKITFQIKTNLGQALQPLAKVASGGELSRISLAIHLATTEQHTIPALIFDEVDVGIGGGTAEIVGKLLRRLGNTHQVICITHQPQVAAQGHHHLRVEKSNQSNVTHTHIHHLSAEERINELARMLGGIKITEKTLEHAREMMSTSQ